MAIAHDDDWCELTNGVGYTLVFTPSAVLLPHDQYDPIDSELVVQLVRSKYSASYYEGMALNELFSTCTNGSQELQFFPQLRMPYQHATKS